MKGALFEKNEEDEIKINAIDKLQINLFFQRPLSEFCISDEENEIKVQEYQLNSEHNTNAKFWDVPVNFNLSKKHDLIAERINEFYDLQKKKKSCVIFNLDSNQEFIFPKNIIAKICDQNLTTSLLNKEDSKDLEGSALINKRKTCRCPKSYCLKNYCECFNKGIICCLACTCKNCCNTNSNSDKRNEAIRKFKK